MKRERPRLPACDIDPQTVIIQKKHLHTYERTVCLLTTTTTAKS